MENDRNEQLNTLKELMLELRVLMEMNIREGDAPTAARCKKQLDAVWEAGRLLEKEAPKKPHVLSTYEFGECGTGWIEHWCTLENDDGTLREPEVFLDRCAWCSNSLTTSDSHMYLNISIPKEYGKKGGFRVWAGDFAPSEEMRKAAPWT